MVALKEVRMEKEKDGLPITTIREIKLLSRLKHSNLICLQEVAVGPMNNQFFLVFEYASHDFADILDSELFVAGKTLSLGDVKNLLLQLLNVVDYLHSHWVLHRDIKVSNMLYFESTGTMKLADFGLARSFTHFTAEALTPETVTLWYRSPEILFDSFTYGPASDIWSVGCVFAQFVLGRPLFPGDTVMDQLNYITDLLGSFHDTWPEVDQLSQYVKSTKDNPDLVTKSRRPFIDTFKPLLGDQGLDLLEKMLQYNPKERITAAAAMEHDFFKCDPLPTRQSDMPSFRDIHRRPPKDLK